MKAVVGSVFFFNFPKLSHQLRVLKRTNKNSCSFIVKSFGLRAITIYWRESVKIDVTSGICLRMSRYYMHSTIETGHTHMRSNQKNLSLLKTTLSNFAIVHYLPLAIWKLLELCIWNAFLPKKVFIWDWQFELCNNVHFVSLIARRNSLNERYFL